MFSSRTPAGRVDITVEYALLDAFNHDRVFSEFSDADGEPQFIDNGNGGFATYSGMEEADAMADRLNAAKAYVSLALVRSDQSETAFYFPYKNLEGTRREWLAACQPKT
jgi:hypothetical protein